MGRQDEISEDELAARRKQGDKLRLSMMDRPMEVKVQMSPRQVLDLIPVPRIIEYLKTKGVEVRIREKGVDRK